MGVNLKTRAKKRGVIIDNKKSLIHNRPGFHINSGKGYQAKPELFLF
jgi:hypothetical protein